MIAHHSAGSLRGPQPIMCSGVPAHVDSTRPSHSHLTVKSTAVEPGCAKTRAFKLHDKLSQPSHHPPSDQLGYATLGRALGPEHFMNLF